MAVTVTFDATLAHSGSDQIQSRRFSARLPVASDKPDIVAVALNQAANQVADEVADWVGR
jgi:cholesterol transport system auxiliary component